MQISYFQLKGDGKIINQDALFDGTDVHFAKLCHAKTTPTPNLPFCVAVADSCPNEVGKPRFFETHFEQFCDVVGADAYGSATTLAGAVIEAGEVQIFNVGDSSVFVIDGQGSWHKLSHDHTILNELFADKLSDDTVYATMYGGLMACLIADADGYEFKVHRTTHTPKRGETLLVCTDGLTDEFTPDELTLMWQSQSVLTDKLAIMLQNLKTRQGHDDYSVVVVMWD